MLLLVLAVGSLATVGLFVDRVRQALQQQETSLIGSDLCIVSTRPLPPTYREMAQTQGLRTVESYAFLSMVTHGEQTLLSEIHAAEADYPLRGKIEIDEGSGGGTRGILTPSPHAGGVELNCNIVRLAKRQLCSVIRSLG